MVLGFFLFRASEKGLCTTVIGEERDAKHKDWIRSFLLESNLAKESCARMKFTLGKVLFVSWQELRGCEVVSSGGGTKEGRSSFLLESRASFLF